MKTTPRIEVTEYATVAVCSCGFNGASAITSTHERIATILNQHREVMPACKTLGDFVNQMRKENKL